MISALISGALASDPVQRTTSAGKAFATASVRCGAGAESIFIGLTTFDETAVPRLLALRKGANVAAAGVLELNIWTDRAGVERRDWRLLANEILSTYSATKRRRESAEVEP